MKTAVIVTAKGSNESIKNKNLLPIMGLPCFLYPVRAAKFCELVDKVFVSTDDDVIKKISKEEGCEIIDRPSHLSTAVSEHKDVIKHAVDNISKEYENVVILLGNTVHVSPDLIGRSIKMLSKDCDSVISVWKAQDDHPFRALSIKDGGYVQSFLNEAQSSNRQSYPEVYFYDQGVWTFKRECAIKQKGPSPWVWLGEKCKTIERSWVTGRDIHSWIDISASIWYLNSIQTQEFKDFKEE